MLACHLFDGRPLPACPLAYSNWDGRGWAHLAANSNEQSCNSFDATQHQRSCLMLELKLVGRRVAGIARGSRAEQSEGKGSRERRGQGQTQCNKECANKAVIGNVVLLYYMYT